MCYAKCDGSMFRITPTGQSHDVTEVSTERDASHMLCILCQTNFLSSFIMHYYQFLSDPYDQQDNPFVTIHVLMKLNLKKQRSPPSPPFNTTLANLQQNNRW